MSGKGERILRRRGNGEEGEEEKEERRKPSTFYRTIRLLASLSLMPTISEKEDFERNSSRHPSLPHTLPPSLSLRLSLLLTKALLSVCLFPCACPNISTCTGAFPVLRGAHYFDKVVSRCACR
jgi:hypothetical protein